MIRTTTSTNDVHAAQERAQRSGFLAEFRRVTIVKFLRLIQLLSLSWLPLISIIDWLLAPFDST